ncbi:MAG TPA: ABC transporter ATP-binding protein [Xanthomonadaceae bacterium]|jgi:peptide/nickel transport system ATP-binding protein|nr:ABC transporter ATP-binding protein [Xanthomonadaceae bacterium]
MTAPPLLALRELRVSIRGTGTDLLGPLDLDVDAGECLAIVGESGAGKSLTTLALLGLLPPALRASGTLHVQGRAIALDSREHVAMRGRALAWVPQDALAALHPLRRIGAQLRETVRHAGTARDAAHARSLQLLERVELPTAETLLARYPHELSGGQRQRVCIALALATQPRILLADEPTSALDPRVGRGILNLLDALRRDLGVALLLVSHDLPLVAMLAQRVLVLHRGRCVETGAVARVFCEPSAAYTRALLAAEHLPSAPYAQAGALLLSADDLSVRYPHAKRDALAPTTIALHRGECLALVGESGSGKSTLARAVLRLLRPPARGRITLDGVEVGALGARALRPMRRRIGVVFQDPFASLDPRMTAAAIVAEPMRIHGIGDTAQRRVRALALLQSVGLDAGTTGPAFMDRYPHEFSGGQCQRIALARALATDPELLVCDEAVSALDARSRAAILQLLARLKAERGLALLFITHDLDAARSLADRIAVMRDGTIVEAGIASEVMSHPQHDYTRELLDARPVAMSVRG